MLCLGMPAVVLGLLCSCVFAANIDEPSSYSAHFVCKKCKNKRAKCMCIINFLLLRYSETYKIVVYLHVLVPSPHGAESTDATLQGWGTKCPVHILVHVCVHACMRHAAMCACMRACKHTSVRACMLWCSGLNSHHLYRRVCIVVYSYSSVELFQHDLGQCDVIWVSNLRLLFQQLYFMLTAGLRWTEYSYRVCPVMMLIKTTVVFTR